MPRTWIDILVRTQQRQRDKIFGTWNVRSLYRTDSLIAVARKLARYKLDLVGVKEISCVKGGALRAGDYNFFYGNEIHQLGKGLVYAEDVNILGGSVHTVKEQAKR